MKSKILNFFFAFLKNIVAFGILIYSFLPIAKFYLKQFPPIGADFYLFVSLLSYLKKFLAWPFQSWNYAWFAGQPTSFIYGLLHSYLALPLTRFFNDTDASRIYMIGTLGVYIIFAYLLFWELSRNRLLSLFLGICLTWSYNFYIGLFAGGTGVFAATQMFLSRSMRKSNTLVPG